VPILLAGLAYADRHGVLVIRESALIRSIGLLMYLSAEGLRVAALRTLGRQYSSYVTVQHHHELVQSGIYRCVRHPIYLAQIMAVPGIALAFRSQLATPLLLVGAIFVRRRIQLEEALLAQTFPEFNEYARRTWKLLPFVY